MQGKKEESKSTRRPTGLERWKVCEPQSQSGTWAVTKPELRRQSKEPSQRSPNQREETSPAYVERPCDEEPQTAPNSREPSRGKECLLGEHSCQRARKIARYRVRYCGGPLRSGRVGRNSKREKPHSVETHDQQESEQTALQNPNLLKTCPAGLLLSICNRSDDTTKTAGSSYSHPQWIVTRQKWQNVEKSVAVLEAGHYIVADVWKHGESIEQCTKQSSTQQQRPFTEKHGRSAQKSPPPRPGKPARTRTQCHHPPWLRQCRAHREQASRKRYGNRGDREQSWKPVERSRSSVTKLVKMSACGPESDEKPRGRKWSASRPEGERGSNGKREKVGVPRTRPAGQDGTRVSSDDASGV
nr:hypothetical protein Iba_chr02cCG4630 [Ipomoea batatas]